MISINPYLNFSGKSEEAFKFYQSIFGGDLLLHRFSDTPETSKIPKSDLSKLMHVALPIGVNNFLMASDTLESMGHKLNPGNNFYISVNTDSKEEAKRIFISLAEGGIVKMDLQDTFWGSYFGMLEDKFGIQWMVDHSTVHH